jgi:DNA relaxase NicK
MMISKIDWISFTFLMEGEQELRVSDLWEAVFIHFKLRAAQTLEALTKGHTFSICKARAPYRYAQMRDDGGCTIFAHPDRDDVLVEITGTGCGSIYAAGMMSQVLRDASERLTRLDVATDILTEIEPQEFASARSAARNKSHSEFTSGSGSTNYVGSRKSDRYARLYRYFPPHPRSHLLRCEVVLKGKQAQAGALLVLEQGVLMLAAQLGNVFGWKHECWQPDVETDEKLAAWRPERRNGSTVAWVYNQCLPAIARLLIDGTLTGDDLNTRLIELGVDIWAEKV